MSVTQDAPIECRLMLTSSYPPQVFPPHFCLGLHYKPILNSSHKLPQGGAN